MADLDTLRPEVREAVQELDGKAYPGSRTHERWQIIRAELLRLDREMDRLHRVACEQLRRAQKAEAELGDMRCDKLNNEAMLAEANELADAAGERADSAEAKANSWMNQVWRFESELDALKKRPATEPQLVPIDCIVHVTVSESWRGKRVQLVLVEDDDV